MSFDGAVEALEAGKPVVVPRWTVGSRRIDAGADLPWDRERIVSVRMSPDDVISPVEGRCAFPGCTAEDYDPDYRDYS